MDNKWVEGVRPLEQKEALQSPPEGQEVNDVRASGRKRQKSGSSAKRANELDGKTWSRNSVSIWSDIRKTSEEVKLGHPAIFPLELVIRLIQCFTSKDDKLVLDPFAGIGSTPIAAPGLQAAACIEAPL